MNYNNYSSIGIDLKIKNIQNYLNDNLGFPNVDFFGRVQKITNDDRKVYPKVLVSNTELKEVYYDDQNAPGGNVFFIDSDKHTTRDGIVFESKVKIVFMLNLNKIDLTKDMSYRTDSEIQDYCIKILRKLKAIEIIEIEKGLKNILSDFDYSIVNKNDFQPYHTFSINGNLKYMFNCKN